MPNKGWNRWTTHCPAQWNQTTNNQSRKQKKLYKSKRKHFMYHVTWTRILMSDTGKCRIRLNIQFLPKMKCLRAIPMSEHQGSDTNTWSKMKSPSNIVVYRRKPSSRMTTLLIDKQFPSRLQKTTTKTLHQHLIKSNIIDILRLNQRVILTSKSGRLPHLSIKNTPRKTGGSCKAYRNYFKRKTESILYIITSKLYCSVIYLNLPG